MRISGILITLLIWLQPAISKNTVIVTEKNTHNFGQLKEDNGPVTTTFHFKNIGKANFIVEEVTSSCGCTTSDYSKDPVKPGKTGYVRVTFDPTNINGSFTKIVTIKGNTRNDLIYYVKGKVIPRRKTVIDDYPLASGNIRFERKQVLFGEIFEGAVDTANLKVFNASDKIINIQNIQMPVHIKTPLKNYPLMLMPEKITEITFYYYTYLKDDIGYVFDKIKLITDDNQMPVKEVFVVADIRKNYNSEKTSIKDAPVFTISKTEHDFGEIKEGKIGVEKLTIKNEGKSKLVIYNIDTECGCTATTLGKRKLEPGEETTFKLVFHTKGTFGLQQKKVVIETNDPKKRSVIFKVKATVLKNE